MQCPYCGSVEDKVVNSRLSQNGESIRRRRECLDCSRRFTTFEVIERIPIHVIKRDGRREEFDRQKILQGVLRACEKRAVSREQAEELVGAVEKTIYNNSEKEISSVDIGEIVLEHLKTLDRVAYVRFASVYRYFTDVNEFTKELKDLLKTEKEKD